MAEENATTLPAPDTGDGQESQHKRFRLPSFRRGGQQETQEPAQPWLKNGGEPYDLQARKTELTDHLAAHPDDLSAKVTLVGVLAGTGDRAQNETLIANILRKDKKQPDALAMKGVYLAVDALGDGLSEDERTDLIRDAAVLFNGALQLDPQQHNASLFTADVDYIRAEMEALNAAIHAGQPPADLNQRQARLRLAVKFQLAVQELRGKGVDIPLPPPPPEPDNAPAAPGEPPITAGEPSPASTLPLIPGMPVPAGEPGSATSGLPPTLPGEPIPAGPPAPDAGPAAGADPDVVQAAAQIKQHGRWRGRFGLDALGRMFSGLRRSPEPPPAGPPAPEVKEQLVNSKIEYQASSTQGGRDYNEDAYLTAAGSYLPDQTRTAEADRQLSGTLETPISDEARRQQAEHLASFLTNLPPELDANVTAQEIYEMQNNLTRFINSGKIQGFAIVADGMGGHDAGERASSLASLLVTRYMMKHYDSVSDKELLLRQAILNADKVSQAINERQVPPTNMSTTFLATLTTADGETVGASVGDSRIYKRNKESLAVDLLTSDTSLVWSLVANNRITPKQLFEHPQRSLVLASISSGDLSSASISTFKTTLADKEQLILCTDGTWESLFNPDGDLDIQAILQKVDEDFQQDMSEIATDDDQAVQKRELATRKAFATIFKEINLNYSHSDWALAEFLTRDIVDSTSGDNTTAVVYDPAAQEPRGLAALGLGPTTVTGAPPQPLMPPGGARSLPGEPARQWPGLRPPWEPVMADPGRSTDAAESGEALDVPQRRDIALALFETDTLTAEQEAVIARGGSLDELLKITLREGGFQGAITEQLLRDYLGRVAHEKGITLHPSELGRMLHAKDWETVVTQLLPLISSPAARTTEPLGVSADTIQVPELPEGEGSDEVAEQFLSDMTYAEYLTDGGPVDAMTYRPNTQSGNEVVYDLDVAARRNFDLSGADPGTSLAEVIEKLERQAVLEDTEMGKDGILSIVDRQVDEKYILQLGGRIKEQDGEPIPTELLFAFNHEAMKEQFLKWLETNPQKAIESILRRFVSHQGLQLDNFVGYDTLARQFRDINIVQTRIGGDGGTRRFERGADGKMIQTWNGGRPLPGEQTAGEQQNAGPGTAPEAFSRPRGEDLLTAQYAIP